MQQQLNEQRRIPNNCKSNTSPSLHLLNPSLLPSTFSSLTPSFILTYLKHSELNFKAARAWSSRKQLLCFPELSKSFASPLHLPLIIPLLLPTPSLSLFFLVYITTYLIKSGDNLWENCGKGGTFQLFLFNGEILLLYFLQHLFPVHLPSPFHSLNTYFFR